ncbi:MAG: alanine--glyoxylate aminotransferase family protein [Myxococcales bacterium FL481]|nr:MAG: alanine--glyoxylate aminotransferase family protein [Myxococcales bacterium FL481]
MTSFNAFTPPARLLLGPGPSPVSPRVLAALAQPTIGHLDPAFVGLMDEIKALLRTAFRTENEMTLPLSGPGSVGMEACVINLIEPGDAVVVCQNGVFGGRMAEVVRRCGGQPIVVESPWGRAVDIERVEAALRAHPRARALGFVHAETSTGARSDAEALARLARAHDCLTIVDAVTSLGGSPLEVDAWDLDAVYSGSQKCLSCVPGLSPVTFSARAMQTIAQRQHPVQSWFLDMGMLASYWQGDGGRSYHHTAPINALYALHEALRVVVDEGLPAAWERHREQHLALIAGLEQLGVSPVVPASERLCQLNCVSIPPGVDEADVRRRLLLDHGIEIGAGLGALAGKVWRIGLMGHGCRAENVERFLTALAGTLDRAGN